MNSNKKYIKDLVSSLMTDDNERVDSLVKKLTESIIPEKEDAIMEIITESFKGDTNV